MENNDAKIELKKELEGNKKGDSLKNLEHPPITDWQLYTLLRRLGLTKYEIQAYVALVKNGPQTISELTGKDSKTGIPQPRAYDIMGSLMKYGLVEENIGVRPRKFRAVPPEEGLNNLLSFFIYAKDLAVEKFNEIKRDSEIHYGGIWEIRNKSNILKAAERITNRAKAEILLVSDYNYLQKLAPTLKRIFYRNNTLISVVLQSSSKNNVDEILEWVNFLKIRYRKNISMPYIVVDKQYALQWGLKSDFGQEIENIDIIHTLIDHFFFSNWKISKPINDNFNRDLDRSYPLKLVNIRSAIDEVEFIRSQGKKASIKVKGRKIETGEKIMIEGFVKNTETNWDSGKFSIYVETKEGIRSVGGVMALFEEISAETIEITWFDQ